MTDAARALPDVSIIMPVLDEATTLVASLDALAPLRGDRAELIVVDGGSHDATVALATPRADRVLHAPRGRAAQMNAGAALARGRIFVFLHADTRLPPDALAALLDGLEASGRRWGRFDVAIAGRHPLLPVIARFMNWRSRLTGIATGDQALFMRRDAFAAVGGFPAIALMEDIAMAKHLKALGPPLCLALRVTTSGRRWLTHGVVRTMVTMWRLRFAYWRGVDPARLARHYGYRPHPDADAADDPRRHG